MKQKQSNSVAPSATSDRQAEHMALAGETQFPGIDPKKLYRTKEVSTLTNFTESYFEAARFRGHGPAFLKCGRAIRYSGQAILDWLKASQREGV